MTDINELAQRMKAAALKAIADEGPTWFSKDQLSHPEGIALHEADVEFIALASHENVLALVEALEAKGKQIDILRQDKDTVIDTSLERINKILSRAEAAEKRIAELEARDVKPVAWRLINSPESSLPVTDNKHIADVWKRNGRDVQALFPASTVGLVPVGTALSEGRQMSAHNKSMVVDVMVESGKLTPGDTLYIAAAAGKGE